MADGRIGIEGLNEFRRELRAVDPAFARELRVAHRQVAETVVVGTRASLRSYGGVRAKSAPSVAVRASQSSAQVKIGGARYPFALGANFGSQRYKQFPAIARPDYSLYTTIAAKRNDALDTYEKALDEIAGRAFPSR